MPDSTSSSTTDQNAYGDRSPYRARLRHLVKRGSRIVRRVFSRPLDPDTAFLPYPHAARPEELGDFAARTTWYLGSWSRSAADAAGDVTVPAYLDASVDIGGAERPVGAKTHYLVWKVSPRTLLRSLLQPAKYTIVDPSLAKCADRDGYVEVADRMGLSLPEGFIAPAPEPRAAVADIGSRSALVLGTGPSAQELQGDHTDWTYRIVCNSAIKDKELMERLRPTHICFGDPVFHSGPSAYAGEFRADLKEVAERYDSTLVVPGFGVAGFAARLPWARGRLLPLDLVNEGGWSLPTGGHLTVRNTGNVLTQQMMPIAIAIASHIDVGGADGRKPEERYFWTHSKQHQYSDELMQTVFTAHPAFFRDTDYEDYYEEHCEAVASLVGYAESLGCTVRAITTSYIPAFAERMPA